MTNPSTPPVRTGLKVIALISGGKDSIFSIVQCLLHGHQVVALANLYPGRADCQDEGPTTHDGSGRPLDSDSFMYQTVGHGLIPLYAEALGLPLYRQEIAGDAVDCKVVYSSPSAQDETESLVPLLRRVMAAHPDATAVCSGAVLSTYQRTRIESVASRLGLVPLAFLWQYPSLPPAQSAAGLLDAMAAVGLDARIVKVASGGLDGQCVWTDVVSIPGRARISARLAAFSGRGGEDGGAIVGEGGEYETLAVDGPAELWKGRIDADFVVSVDGDGGTAIALFGPYSRVVPKDADCGRSIKNAIRPDVFDPDFRLVLDAVNAVGDGWSSGCVQTLASPGSAATANVPAETVSAIGESVLVANLAHPSCTLSPADQMAKIGCRLAAILARLDRSPDQVIHTTVLLRDIADFAAINNTYLLLFCRPLPPSRVTVACGDRMPPNCSVLLSALVGPAESGERREGLHVQSRSYWAPANIGPYSQVIVEHLEHPSAPADADIHPSPSPNLVWFAGQIPLEPATMTVYRHPTATTDQQHFCAQTVVGIQHLFRIARQTRAERLLYGIAFVDAGLHDSLPSRARSAVQLWDNIQRQIHQSQTPSLSDDETDESGPDAWDLRHGALSHNRSGGQHYQPLFPAPGDLQSVPPAYVVQVQALPAAVPVEWASVGVRGGNQDRVCVKVRVPAISHQDSGPASDGETLLVHASQITTGHTSIWIVSWAEAYGGQLDLTRVATRAVQAVGGGSVNHAWFTLYTASFDPAVEMTDGHAVQLIPCRAVFDSQGQKADRVVVGRLECCS